MEGDLHVSGMHPNNEADINLLLSYGQDPCETVEVAQAVSRLHASGYVVELRARAIAAAAKPNVVAAARSRSNAGMAAAAAARSNAGIAAAAMSTDDVVNLVDSDDDFDVTMVGEELKKNKTYKTALVILQGRKYGSPTHDTQLKLLFGFKDKAAVPFFRKDSSQAKEFNAIQQQLLSNAKKTASTIKKEYTVSITADFLAKLLVLKKQAKSLGDPPQLRSHRTRYASSTSAKSAKSNEQKAFKRMARQLDRLEDMYSPCLEKYALDQKKKECVRHRTPTLDRQEGEGARAQDLVPWGKYSRILSGCPVCIHDSTQPLQSSAVISAESEVLRAAALANDGNGKFNPPSNKSGCYCFCQNCFGNENGFGCWYCIELAMERGPGVPGLRDCQFDCPICKCICQVLFEENKRHTIAASLKKIEMQESGTKLKTKNERATEGRHSFFGALMDYNQNNALRQYQSIDGRTEEDIHQDIDTDTALSLLHDNGIQSNMDMHRGLREVIPGRSTTIQTHRGGTMSIVAARKKLLPAQSRKRPSVDDDDGRPSDSIYISNAGNRQHRNHLSRLPLDPHSTTSRNRALSPIHEEQPDMTERVAARLLSTMISPTEDSPVKASATKAYDKLSKKDDGIINFVSAVSKNGDKLSQDIANCCIDYQHRLDK